MGALDDPASFDDVEGGPIGAAWDDFDVDAQDGAMFDGGVLEAGVIHALVIVG